MLAYLLEDIFRIFFAALCHKHAKFNKIRRLNYVDAQEAILPLFAPLNVHLSEDF